MTLKETRESVVYELNNLGVWVNDLKMEVYMQMASKARADENYGIEKKHLARVRKLDRKNRVLLRKINDYRNEEVGIVM